MQGRRCAIIAHISNQPALGSEGINSARVRRLMDELTLGEYVQEVAFKGGHRVQFSGQVPEFRPFGPRAREPNYIPSILRAQAN